MRDDPHRPSAIEPADYEFVACFCVRFAHLDLSELGRLREERQMFLRHREETGGVISNHDHGGMCHICGAHCIDYAIFHHAKTNTYIETGFDCAEKMHIGDPRRFRDFRKARKSAEEMRAGRAKAQATLEEADLGRAWELYQWATLPGSCAYSVYSDYFLRLVGVEVPARRQDEDATEQWRSMEEEGDVPQMNDESRRLFSGLDYRSANRLLETIQTIQDIVGKLARYGSVSEKQQAFLARLVEDVDHNIPEQCRRRAEEDAQAEDAPEGRVRVEGEVLSLKSQPPYHPFGSDTLKMLLRDDRGFKVWVTVPYLLEELSHGRDATLVRGARVRMTVTLEPKADDPKFAIGKRPSRAEVVA